MPYSSKDFTKLASEKRGGGSVKCWSPYILSTVKISPVSRGGSLRESSSSLEASSKLSV